MTHADEERLTALRAHSFEHVRAAVRSSEAGLRRQSPWWLVGGAAVAGFWLGWQRDASTAAAPHVPSAKPEGATWTWTGVFKAAVNLATLINLKDSDPPRPQ